ncbi:unnamed protein product [Dicrocoelium dendriticum]|nr:unnamed protein product [Dicrocoelium dendriticum]
MNSNQALVMEEMAFFALLLLCLLIQACNSNHLILIDSSEILSAPRASSWDFVIQNPFKGVIEVAPSPVDQFQLLINVSSTHQSPERVGYRLRHTDDSIYVELFSRAASTSLSSSSGDEERIYLQLLFITVASLVLVSFVVSIIFSCWWLRSQRCEDADQMTNAVYCVALPSEPIPPKDISDTAQADVDTCDEPELVELLPSGAGSPQKPVGSNQPTAQLYISPTAAYATISMASDPSLLLGGASADGPISYPVPRYVVSGGLGASLTPAQSIFNEHAVLGAPIIIPAEAASFLQSTVNGRHPSPPLAYLSLGGILNPISNPSSVGLGASSSSGIGSIRGVCPTTVHSSSHTCTLPAKRHVAMEFLDENVVATMTRPRSRCRQTILPEAMHAVTRTVQSASASTAVLPLHPQVLLIPGDNSTDSVAKHPLGPAVATALIPRGSVTSPENGVTLWFVPVHMFCCCAIPPRSLRFTTLTLITFLWLLVVIVLGSPDVVPSANYAHSGASQVLRWNVIKPSPLASKPKSQVADDAPEVHLTVWIPQDMIAKIKSGRASLEGEKKDLPKGGLTAPASIQLWLNASSRTEIRLASQIDRAIVHIYDAVNAHQNLGARICRQRYACEHSCDPGARHDCICQRGYRPAGPKDRERLLAQGNRLANVDLENIKGRICLDLDECAHAEIRDRCSRMGGVCTNRPGDYACLCPSGQPCLDCDATCPVGFWAQGDCSHNRSIECKPCSGPCPTGMYETKPCGPRSDRMCQACRPLCISEEFEFAPCKASSNRICKRKNLIPELTVPYKKNVWFENLLQVKDVVFTLAPDDLSRLPLNKSVVLDRSSGYQIRLDFDSLNLLPVLGPVDHSNGNDNALFLASARALDRSITEPDTYRWSSSSSGHYQAVHAYVIKANNTLSRLCPYPVPPLYRLGVRVHRNVTTATVAVTDLPGHRPVLAACRTYRTHGYFPPVEDTSALLGKLSTTFVTEDDRVYGHARPAEPFTNQDITAPVVACLEPSKLPAIFGPHWNSQLASSRSIYYEGKRL